MYQEQQHPIESAHIANELFDDADHELERQCQSVEHAETRGILSREKALKAFKVTPEQYTGFLAKRTSKILLPGNHTYISWSDNAIAVHAMAKTLQYLAAKQSPHNKAQLKHLAQALKIMKQLSMDTEREVAIAEDHI